MKFRVMVALFAVIEPGKGIQIKTLARHTYTDDRLSDEMVIDQFRAYVMDYVHRTLEMDWPLIQVLVEDVDESVLVAYVNRKYDLEIEVNPNEKSL